MIASSPGSRSPDAVPPASTVDDGTLVEQIRRGNVSAFEELYRRYWVRLYEACFRYLQSADEAADVVQDVFFRIWRGRATWRVVGRLDRYLYLAIRNGAFDALEHAAVVERWRKGVQADQAVLAQAKASAEEALQGGEFAAAVERALAEMPERRRAVCTLRWADGLTYTEIAARLSISEKTVENHIGRGLRFLRERVAELHS